MYWSILSSCFDRLANGVIFPAEFCVFFLQVRRDSLANFRAQIARENLRREKGVEGIRRAFEKMKGCLKKKVHCMVPFCFGM